MVDEFRPGIDDVLRTDPSGEVDLELLEHNLALTPTARIQEMERFRQFVRLVRDAGRKRHGDDPGPAAATG